MKNSKYVGKIFGKLTVLSIDNEINIDRTYYLCACSCGNKISVRGEKLKDQEIPNCGCLDAENALKIVNSYGYNLLKTYTDNFRRVIIEDFNGYKADVRLIKLVYHNGNFNFVDPSNPFSLENLSLWIKNNEKRFELCDDNTYENSNAKLKFKCLICDEIFLMGSSQILRGQNCAICSGQQVGAKNNLKYLRPEICLEWNYAKNTSTPDNFTVSSKMKVWWICKNKHEWVASICDRSRKDRGRNCPICASSKGENLIREFLSKLKIEFIQEYSYSECKFKNKLPFDFHLPNHNINIEFHGEHHYQPVDFCSHGMVEAEENFRLRKIKDQIKREYCQKNKINLLEIPYWEFDNGNVENILLEYLNLETINYSN